MVFLCHTTVQSINNNASNVETTDGGEEGFATGDVRIKKVPYDGYYGVINFVDTNSVSIDL